LLQDRWSQETEGHAKRVFNDWHRKVSRTKKKPMTKMAKILKEQINNIVTHCTHGITNGVA
jgi:transposase